METNKLPVLVKISSAERNQLGQLEGSMQLTAPGTLEKRGQDWILHYQETIEDEGDHSRVTHEVYLQVKGDRVTLLRKGAYGMMIMLEQNKRYETDYHTPYGKMSMSVYPILVQAKMDEAKGVVRLEYQLEVQGYASMRRMVVEYSTKSSGTKLC